MNLIINKFLCTHFNLFVYFIFFITSGYCIYTLPFPVFNKFRFIFILIVLFFLIKIVNEKKILISFDFPTYITIPGLLIFSGIYYNLIFYSLFNFNSLLYFSIEDYTISILKFLAIEFMILFILGIALTINSNKLYVTIGIIIAILLNYFFKFEGKTILFVYLTIIIASCFYFGEEFKFLYLNTTLSKILAFHFVFIIMYPYTYGEILKSNSSCFLKNKLNISIFNNNLIFLDQTIYYDLLLDKKTNSIILKKRNN